MKALKTKVIMSAIVLVFAFIATIGSTYAWFTVTTENTVSDIQLNVKSEKSLVFMVSDSGEVGEEEVRENYKTELTNAAFSGLDGVSGSQYEGFDDWKMGAATAATGGTGLAYTGLDTSTGSITFGTFTDPDTRGSASINQTTGGVIQLDFWLLNQGNSSETVTLQDLTVTPNGVPSIVDALRVATSTAGTANKFFAPVLPDYNFAFDSGTVLAGPTQTLLTDDHSEWFASSSAVAGVSNADIGTAETIITLAADTPTLISVYIYLEGWDADTNALILNANFAISFVFAMQ